MDMDMVDMDTVDMDMVEIDMADMDMVEMDMVDMDIVEMDMVDRKFLIVIYLGRLPRIISRTCLDSLVLL